MMPWHLVKVLWTSFVVSKMYLVLAYGVLENWPLTASNGLQAIGYAYLISRIKE